MLLFFLIKKKKFLNYFCYIKNFYYFCIVKLKQNIMAREVYPIGPLGLPLKSEEEQAIYYRQLEEERYMAQYRKQMIYEQHEREMQEQYESEN